MKKQIRVIALMLAIFSLLSVATVFTSCSQKGKAVLEYDGHTVSEGMYSYWMNNLKEYYVTYYADIKDTPEYWNSKNELGVTNGEYIENQIKTRINYYLVGAALFDSFGLKLSKSSKDEINLVINDQISHYGSRSEYAKVLKASYGMTVSEMREALTFEEKYYAVYSYLYDDKNGVETANEAELDEYYNNYYARVKYVMFLKNIKYLYNDDGTRKTDSSGYFLTEELSDTEKEQVTAQANEVYQRALDGESMNDLMEEYMKQYGFKLENTPNGFFITADDYTEHSATVTSAALEMEIGEVRLCESQDCYFVIKKFDLPEKGYASTTDSGQFKNFVTYVNSKKFAEKFAPLIEKITENKEISLKYIFEEL